MEQVKYGFGGQNGNQGDWNGDGDGDGDGERASNTVRRKVAGVQV